MEPPFFLSKEKLSNREGGDPVEPFSIRFDVLSTSYGLQ
jgi:hypothetical protein